MGGTNPPAHRHCPSLALSRSYVCSFVLITLVCHEVDDADDDDGDNDGDNDGMRILRQATLKSPLTDGLALAIYTIYVYSKLAVMARWGPTDQLTLRYVAGGDYAEVIDNVGQWWSGGAVQWTWRCCGWTHTSSQ